MGFGPFALLSLFYVVIGVRFLGQLARAWRPTFDHRFTQTDRWMVDQAAFFLLVPISVALHELGHAIAVWTLGGDVVGFGFFVFAGYVSYRAPFTEAEQILVALAGPFVNVLLSAAALGVVLVKRPPLRAAFNELLIQFAFLSGVNALVFYPLLDFATGLDGDWSQMYFGDLPALSGAILAGHVGVLALGWWLWKNPGMAGRFATLTGTPRGAGRRLMGGLRPVRTATTTPQTPQERLLDDAGRRVISGWAEPVQLSVETNAATGPMLTLAWTRGGRLRAVIARVSQNGEIDLFGGIPEVQPNGPATLTIRTRLGHLAPAPDTDSLTMALRLAMEEVDRWQVAPSGHVETAPTTG